MVTSGSIVPMETESQTHDTTGTKRSLDSRSRSVPLPRGFQCGGSPQQLAMTFTGRERFDPKQWNELSSEEQAAFKAAKYPETDGKYSRR